MFRFETFGNERFWTDALRLPAGIMASIFTPVRALQNGLHIDSEAIPAALRDALVAELRTDLSAARAPLRNNVSTTVALVNANAVIGLRAKDTDRNGRIDILAGDKVAACALCHTITDGSVASMPNGGSIGRRFILPGDMPAVLLPQRMAPLDPILNTPNNIFDDKMAVVNASLRGLERGTALPLLLDLARKPVFLHDNSVPSLEVLLDPGRGPTRRIPSICQDRDTATMWQRCFAV